MPPKLRVAVIGQSLFGATAYSRLREDGHTIVGVFTVPDVKGRPDPIAIAAEKDGVPVFKVERWKALKKDGGAVIPAVLDQYKSVGAELNVLAFVTQFIPMEVNDFPKHGSIIYHPSLLPRHRGASAINWALMCGDKKTGFTVFWADDGLDTGPILLMKECPVKDDDTVNTLYSSFLFPEGINEAVQLIAEGRAPRITQPTEGATYDPIWKNKDQAKIDWSKTAEEIHNFIRGNDKVPGAWANINGQQVTVYGSTYIDRHHYFPSQHDGPTVEVEGASQPGIVTEAGLVLTGSDGKRLLVQTVQVGAKTMPASKILSPDEGAQELELTPEEKKLEAGLKSIWQSILGAESIRPTTDFFASGAGSMDVTRLTETVRAQLGVAITPEQVFMNTKFGDFVTAAVLASRSGGEIVVEYDAHEVEANSMKLRFPTQLFIDGEFCNALSSKTIDTINPTTEEVICQVQAAGVEDVDVAVKAAKKAFETGEWRSMNARDRGRLMYKLADGLEAAKEELATLESLDSGAVYTLAVKTHIGMSIDTFRYFAGLCDKVSGRVIPINHARPNYDLCFTKKEPIGVVGLVIPWNYPLMMLAWKMAAALAAGNTVVTPLTALKFAEISARVGFPKGVINILPGLGPVAGQALAEHPLVSKLGFTGSTKVGKIVMEAAAKSNAKRVSLELGGKSPLIVFADADLTRAVRNALGACFFNKGENCIAAGRIFVEDSIHDEFVRLVVEETKKITIGDPLDRSVSHGPQNHKAHLDKLVAYIQKGVEEGATLAYGGKRVDRKGYFLQPTVFTNVKDDVFIAKEESFGPIMIISTFDGSVDTVLRRANNTDYGLSSGVFTRDINKALRVVDGLQAGTCYINTYNKTDVASPFGGFKQSGFGKDLGEEALNEYLQTKAVTIEYS
eukprot:jgi/Chlat1/3518/Chrsp23S03699